MTTYPEPANLTGGERLEAVARFGLDPIAGTRWIRNHHGPFVVFRDPFSSRPKSYGLVSDPELYRALVADEGTWRNVSITLKGSKVMRPLAWRPDSPGWTASRPSTIGT